MKKIAFLANNLDIGGIERAILNYLKYIDKSKYDITLFLDDASGIYYDQVPKEIKVIGFNMAKDGNALVRKTINFLKLLYFSIKYYNKFDFAASFTTTVKSNTILAKIFSKNNAIWYHGDYWSNDKEAKKFIKYSNSLKYEKVVFVSNFIKEKYQNYTNSNQNLYVINNPIDSDSMLDKGKIDLGLTKQRTTLVNVGRHEDKAKNISMLISVVNDLLNNGYDFDFWLIGDGPDSNMYKKMVKDYGIEDHVLFFGKQSNVFPFYKLADALAISSRMEGNPVVYLESKVMNVPIISTDVTDAKSELFGYGIVCDNNENALYDAIKFFLENGFVIKNKFDPIKYNNEVLKKLYEVIGI